MSQIPPPDIQAKRKLQCKDIPDWPILKFLRLIKEGCVLVCYYHMGPFEPHTSSAGTLFDGFQNSVHCAFPQDIRNQSNLIRAKMGKLIAKGLVSGCACGCRGNFQITELGEDYLRDRRI